jgi:hypothetical protein
MNIIRKIIIGQNPKDALAYFIGMRAGQSEVSAIELDDRAFTKYGMKCYNIYIQSEDGTMLWKRVEDMPVTIEYDCHFD